MRHFVSAPLELGVFEGVVAAFDRADVVFYDVEHECPSYEARVFVDNSDADANTPREREHGYAGSFTVFGHSTCVGEHGHCDPSDRYVDEFDKRAPHPQIAWTKVVTVTEALKRFDQATVTVTVVPVIAGPDGPESPDIMTFKSLRLAMYRDDDIID